MVEEEEAEEKKVGGPIKRELLYFNVAVATAVPMTIKSSICSFGSRPHLEYAVLLLKPRPFPATPRRCLLERVRQLLSSNYPPPPPVYLGRHIEVERQPAIVHGYGYRYATAHFVNMCTSRPLTHTEL